MKKLLVIVSLLFVTIPAFSLETKIALMFWYDNTPPTKNDQKFFEGVRDALNVLESNNNELQDIADSKNISIVDNDYAKKIVNDLLKKHNIKKDFFYNLETAQLIMVVKMLINNSHVSNEYNFKTALKYSEQFVLFAKSETSKNRDLSKNISFNTNDVLLGVMVGGFVASMVNSMFNSPYDSYNESDLSSSNFGELQHSEFGTSN